MCRQERLEMYSDRFCKYEHLKDDEKEKDKPISSESLKKLVDKFRKI